MNSGIGNKDVVKSGAVQNIGVLGAGQLGRMLALAGYPLGNRFTFLDTTGNPSQAQRVNGVYGVKPVIRALINKTLLM